MTDNIEPCGIQHRDGGQTCSRPKGHSGYCRCLAERRGSGIMYSEWQSRDGRFLHHIGYRTIYPHNAALPHHFG